MVLGSRPDVDRHLEVLWCEPPWQCPGTGIVEMQGVLLFRQADPDREPMFDQAGRIGGNQKER
jgi:hypothetical protein